MSELTIFFIISSIIGIITIIWALTTKELQDKKPNYKIRGGGQGVR